MVAWARHRPPPSLASSSSSRPSKSHSNSFPRGTTCDQLRVTADKLRRSSLCGNVSNMLFASPTAKNLHDMRHSSRIGSVRESFAIGCLGDLAHLARPSRICFRYTQVPRGCGCISALVNTFVKRGMSLEKVSIHAQAADLPVHQIIDRHQTTDFEVFLTDKTRNVTNLAKHLSSFALSNPPCGVCNAAVAIKVVTPECDTENLMQEIQGTLEENIGRRGRWSLDLISRSNSSPREVCEVKLGLFTACTQLTSNL